MEIGISRITLISAKSHTWSQVDLYHVLYLPEINDWPLHSGKTVSVSAKMQFHAWVTNSGSPLADLLCSIPYYYISGLKEDFYDADLAEVVDLQLRSPGRILYYASYQSKGI